MKLAFLIFKYYPYGGLQRDCLRLAKFCADQGHEVQIMTLQWQGEQPDNLEIKIIPKRGFSNHQCAVNFANDVRPLLSDFDKVIGFDRMPYLDFYFAGDLCFAKNAREKHGSWFRFTQRYRNFCRLEKQVFEEGIKAKIFVLTEYVKNTYQEYYHTEESRFILTPPGIQLPQHNFETIQANKAKYQQQLSFKGQFNVLQVGSDFKRKGVDRSIRAMAALSPELKNKTHLYILGRGQAAPYEKLAKQLNIAEHIHFLGTKDDITVYMQAADLLIHTAYFETAGMVLVEALTFGLPVLVTESCGYAFHIARANAGMMVKMPFSQQQLNDNLQSLLDKSRLEQLGENALNYAYNTDLYSMQQRCLEEIKK